jgi:hypothetical protein
MVRSLNKTPANEWTVGQSLFTKDGAPIVITYKADVERPNRGFITDKLEAHVDGELAGYLKIENVPIESLNIFYPSGPINYAAQIQGKCVLPYRNETADLRTCDLATLNAIVSFFHRNEGSMVKAQVECREEFEELFDKHIRKTRAYRRMDEAYREFVSYRVDKPIVQFSNTENPAQSFDPSRRDFSRKGIGRALYIAAALELEARGLTLRKSTLCSDSAAALWGSLARDGLVTVRDGGRTEIDPQAVRATFDVAIETVSPSGVPSSGYCRR